MQRTQVCSLVGELRFHINLKVAQPKKKNAAKMMNLGRIWRLWKLPVSPPETKSCTCLLLHYMSLIKKLSGRRQWHPTPVLLPGKSHGRRSLVGCSTWGHEESDTTEQLPFHFSLSCIGEGNGNPLQCSCLENPRDGGAWWAAVCGVTQSRTQLKWLSLA